MLLRPWRPGALGGRGTAPWRREVQPGGTQLAPRKVTISQPAVERSRGGGWERARRPAGSAARVRGRCHCASPSLPGQKGVAAK